MGDDKTKNIAHAREAVAKAAKEGANIVALPGGFSIISSARALTWLTAGCLVIYNHRMLEWSLCHLLLSRVRRARADLSRAGKHTVCPVGSG